MWITTVQGLIISDRTEVVFLDTATKTFVWAFYFGPLPQVTVAVHTRDQIANYTEERLKFQTNWDTNDLGFPNPSHSFITFDVRYLEFARNGCCK